MKIILGIKFEAYASKPLIVTRRLRERERETTKPKTKKEVP